MTWDSRINWRYARLDALRRSNCAARIAPLSPQERVERDRMVHAGRREEWSLARVLARQLLGDQLAIGDSTIEIRSRDPRGRHVAPRVKIGGQAVSLSLSITHTETAALVALCTLPGVSVGVDLTRKTTLSNAFLTRWLTEEERRDVEMAGADQACRLWAVKEAVYKAANRNDPFRPRQVCISRGGEGEFLARYCGVDFGSRCHILTWECDDQIAALVTLNRLDTAAPPHVAERRDAESDKPVPLALLTSLRTSP